MQLTLKDFKLQKGKKSGLYKTTNGFSMPGGFFGGARQPITQKLCDYIVVTRKLHIKSINKTFVLLDYEVNVKPNKVIYQVCIGITEITTRFNKLVETLNNYGWGIILDAQYLKEIKTYLSLVINSLPIELGCAADLIVTERPILKGEIFL